MSADRNHQLIRLSETGRFWQLEFEDLSRPEQVFRAVWELEGEVNNGGFDQYFFNSSGDSAFAVVDALREIGAENTARIAARANAVFPDSRPPRDRDARQTLLDQLGPDQTAALEELDTEFCRGPDDLTELLHDYVSRYSGAVAGAAAAGF